MPAGVVCGSFQPAQLIERKTMKLLRKSAMLSALALASVAQAQAEVPADITEITTNATAVFTSVKTLVVGVVAFFVLIKFVKMIRRT